NYLGIHALNVQSNIFVCSSDEESSQEETSEPHREVDQKGRKVCSICKSPTRHKPTCSLYKSLTPNRRRATRSTQESTPPSEPEQEPVKKANQESVHEPLKKHKEETIQKSTKQQAEVFDKELPESPSSPIPSSTNNSSTHQRMQNERRILGENGRHICAQCGRPGRHKRDCVFNPERDIRSSSPRKDTNTPANSTPPEPIVLEVDDHSDDDQSYDEPLIDSFVNCAVASGPVESPFLSKMWKECQTTLPKVQGLQIEQSLDRSKWPSWKYTLPDPLLSSSPSLDEGQFTYGGHDIFIWCPFTFFPHAIDISTLKCIACGGTGVVADGWTRGFHPILSLNGRKSYVKCRRLRHPKCPKAESTGASGMKFSSFHKTLLTQWYSPHLLATLPFRLLGKRFVSLDLLTFCNEMHGKMSSEELVQLLETMEDTWLQRRQDIVAQCTIIIIEMTDWFQVLFGFKERSFTYTQVQKKFEIIDGTKLKCMENEAVYDIGSFECVSLKSLREKAKEEGIRGHVRVSHVASKDVFMLHCDRENNHAVFQAASQFNCLEFAHPRARPKDGVTIYAHDPTQGPACAIAAGPGTVYRNYFAEVKNEQENTIQIGQSTACQINNLDDVEDLLENHVHQYFHVINGYTDATDKSLRRLNRVLSTIPENILCDALKVGVHWNVQVPFEKRYKLVSIESPLQTVTQVYCSAISCGYSYAKTESWALFARIVLKASYEATLWTAILNAVKTSCNMVYLTILGGGVFGNERSWILEAIASAVQKCAEFDLHVIIVHYKAIDTRLVKELKSLIKNE
ncbi:hypothetical protein THRCLA_10409, partial [Thraustotheca clavata]